MTIALFVENLNLNTKLKNVVKKLGVKSFDELFSITKEDLLNLDEVGELSAGKILTAIDSYKKLKTI